MNYADLPPLDLPYEAITSLTEQVNPKDETRTMEWDYHDRRVLCVPVRVVEVDDKRWATVRDGWELKPMGTRGYGFTKDFDIYFKRMGQPVVLTLPAR